MADPLSITGLALQIGTLIQSLYTYGHSVKSARKDINDLCTDLLALRGILEDLSNPPSSPLDPQLRSRLSFILDLARGLVSDLLERLKPEGEQVSNWKSKAKRSLKWPFDKASVQEVLGRLERIKSALLLVLMRDSQAAVERLEGIEGELREVRLDVRGLVGTVGEEVRERKERELREGLGKARERIAPVSPAKMQGTLKGVWMESSSGGWFLEGPLRTWLDGEGVEAREARLMALCGISGAGKSTIVSRAVEFVREEYKGGRVRVAYFYCVYNEVTTHEVKNILGSWLVQLLDGDDGAAEELAVFGQYSSRDTEIPTDALQNALVSVAERLGDVLLILDALNESTQSGKLVAAISTLLASSNRIRCLVSSTLPVEGVFSSLQCPHIRVSMAPKLIERDITEYVRGLVKRNQILSQVGEDKIIEAVVPKANGMFRWAACQMTILSDYITVKMVLTALKDLPGTLNDIYVLLLQRVPVMFRKIVREALMWLTFSFSLFTLREFIDAIVIEIGDNTIDDSCRIQPPHRILELCQGLVIWDSENDLVSLAHGSVATFLQSDFIQTSPMSYYFIDHATCSSTIIQKSLAYILMDPFEHADHFPDTVASLSNQYPLVGYASCMWALHAQDYVKAYGQLRQSDISMILKLFKSYRTVQNGGQFIFWIRCLLPHTSPSIIEAATPLYYAASFGLTPLIILLYEQGIIELKDPRDPWYIDRKSGRCSSTPLCVASVRGHLGAVSALLTYGANPNTLDSQLVSPLSWARLYGHKKVINLLRKWGAVDQGEFYFNLEETLEGDEDIDMDDTQVDDNIIDVPYSGLLYSRLVPRKETSYPSS